MASFADHVAPSSTCRIAVSQPKLASKFGASMLPGASDSVTCFSKNGSGASTASYLVPAVRLTATAYQRLTTPSRLQKKRLAAAVNFRIGFESPSKPLLTQTEVQALLLLSTNAELLVIQAAIENAIYTDPKLSTENGFGPSRAK